MAQSPADAVAVPHVRQPAVTLATPVCRFEDFLGAAAADRLLEDACRAQLEHLAAERGQGAPVPALWRSPERVLRAPGLAEAVRGVAAVVQDMLGVAAPSGRMGYEFIARGHQDAQGRESEATSRACVDPAGGENDRAVSFVYTLHRRPREFTGGGLHVYDTTIRDGYPACAESLREIRPDHDTLTFFPASAWRRVQWVSCPSGRLVDGRFSFEGWLA
ncbi:MULTISPECIES: 2OG-Fe(II) oxygenase [unclassified Streptomyces]|uniref:2OG-Fe(II) oxygenase n=1 Tax=unclassified Streptomyces TaxID=2593676 RepID=UPI003331D3EC